MPRSIGTTSFPVVSALPSVGAARDGDAYKVGGTVYVLHGGSWTVLGGSATPAGTGLNTLIIASGYQVYGAGFTAPAYYRDQTGRVHLQGMISTSNGGVGYGGAAFASLPAGFRPAGIELLDAIANEAQARIDVRPDGDVALAKATATPSGYMSLGGLSFMVAGGPYVGTNSPVPQMRVSRTSPIALPNGTIFGIPWQAAAYDTGAPSAQWDGGGAFVCRVAGLYRFTAVVNMTHGATVAGVGRRLAGMTWTPTVGSAKVIGQAEIGVQNSTSAYPAPPLATEMRLGVGDTVYVWAYQDSGVAMAIDTSAFFTASYASP